MTYEATTRLITVTAESFFLDEDSEPDESQFLWAYRIRILNGGDDSVQLLNRYWRITDGGGRMHEVRGAGVVGEQPHLKPGEIYEYMSGTPLKTPSGFMQGHYEMVGPGGEHFEIEIPAFSLDSPYAFQRVQ